jgi:hypothetical protein
MSGDSPQGSSEQNKNIGAERVTADFTELDRQRAQIEKDQLLLRLTGKIALPVVSYLALFCFVGFAVFAAFWLGVSSANLFSYAVIVCSFVLSGVFGVLAFFSRRALTQTQFTFVSVFSRDAAGEVAKAHPIYADKLKEAQTVVVKEPRTLAEFIMRKQNGDKTAKERRFQHILLPAFILILFGVAISALVLFAIQKSALLTNTALNQISILGVILLVISYIAFLSLGRRAAAYLHEPSIWSTRLDVLKHVDYIFGMFPIRIRAGDSRQVLLRFFREDPACTIGGSEYLEAEIQAAGVDISSEKKLRLPDCFTSQKILWSCLFAHMGKHTVTLSLNRVEPDKSTKDIVYATDFTTEVVSPFRASLQAAATVVISAASALAALLTALHIHL